MRRRGNADADATTGGSWRMTVADSERDFQRMAEETEHGEARDSFPATNRVMATGFTDVFRRLTFMRDDLLVIKFLLFLMCCCTALICGFLVSRLLWGSPVFECSLP